MRILARRPRPSPHSFLARPEEEAEERWRSGSLLRIEESVFYEWEKTKTSINGGRGCPAETSRWSFGSRLFFSWLKGSLAGWLLAGGGGGPCASS